MSNNNWFNIWSNRKTNALKKIDLEDLIFYNGFDSPLGRMKKNDWLAYINNVSIKCDLKADDSIFEVGCGSGAFLLPFFNLKHKVSGIDYSEKLISIANLALKGNFEKLKKCEADNIDTKAKFDVVVSNHVFHYFNSIEYSFNVLKKMLLKCNKKIVILGLPNISHKKESELTRRGLLTIEEYKKKYSDLNILYFDKLDLKTFAKTNNAKVNFFDHNMPGFKQNKFRFDCIISKI